MTSSRLRTKAYEAVREKTIFPLVARLRQQSQNQEMTIDENATSSEEVKGGAMNYHKDEEKENTCSSHGPDLTISTPAMASEPSDNLVIEEELDAGMVPTVDVVMSEPTESEFQIDVTSNPIDTFPSISAATTLSQSLISSLQSQVTSSPIESQLKFSVPETNAPSNLSQPAKSFKFHDNTFETMKALEQIQGQFKQSQCVQSAEKPTSVKSSPCNSSSSTSVSNSPKVDTPVVPRKRGRPKGSTTKNRKIKNIGGLNLWGHKASKNKLSTLELLAMSAQRQHVHQQQQQQQQQNDSQAMLNLLVQQQLQQQLLGMGSNQDTMQLLMACGPSVQQSYSEHQQQALMAQQQQLLVGAHHEPKIANIQPNQLLEMQLQHEISNLEKILAAHGHAAEQKLVASTKAPQTMDLGMYQLSNLAGQSPGQGGLSASQGGLSAASASKVLKPSVGEFPSSVVSESLQKEAQQNALLRETMMKLQGQTLQNSRASPNGIFSTAGSGVPQSVMSTAQTPVMGYSPSFSHTTWSSAGSLDTPTHTISSPLVPTSLSPQKPAPKQASDASDDVTRQFLELIKSLGSDPAQTEQLLQLLAGQISSNVPAPSAPSSSVQTPFSQSQPAPNVLASPPPLQPAQQQQLTSPIKADALSKMSDLEQLISSLKSPTLHKTPQPAFFAPKIKSSVQLDHLLPKPRGRPPGSSNGSPSTLVS